MFCVKCGAENSDTGKFCRKCGQLLHQSKPTPEAVESKPVVPPPFTATPVSKLPTPEPQVQPAAVPSPATQPVSSEAVRQPVVAQTAPATTTSGMGIQPNIAAALSYVAGWVTGIVFLLMAGKNEFIKFHAWQSIITFGSLTILSVLFPIFSFIFRGLPLPLVIIYYLIVLLVIALWIFLIIKAYQSHLFKLPVIGDIAIQMMKKY